MSLWFRVPKTSINAASAQVFPDSLATRFMFGNTLPLLTFGQQQYQKEFFYTLGNINGGEPVILSVVGSTTGKLYSLSPCHIGLDCTDANNPVLVFRLQTGGLATGIGNSVFPQTATSSGEGNTTAELIELIGTPGSGWTLEDRTVSIDGIITGSAYSVHWSNLADFSSALLDSEPEYFYVKTLKTITPDHWHHVLLSFDISQPIITAAPPVGDPHFGKTVWANVSEGTSSYAKMWYAIDDVDYRGRGPPDPEAFPPGYPTSYLGPYSVDYIIPDAPVSTAPVGDPNGILTLHGWYIAYNGQNPIVLGNVLAPHSSYRYQPMVPAAGAPVGIPAASAYVNYVHHVETAEFQLFTGLAIDTGDVANRRLFITDAVKPELKYSNVDTLLGKPKIRLHGSGNWIKGKNTGTGGRFSPRGRIIRYKPDPSLNGPQGKPQ